MMETCPGSRQPPSRVTRASRTDTSLPDHGRGVCSVCGRIYSTGWKSGLVIAHSMRGAPPPIRVQQRRGVVLPQREGVVKPTVSVARPSRWGNPYKIGGLISVSGTQYGTTAGRYDGKNPLVFDGYEIEMTAEIAVRLYRHDLELSLDPERSDAPDVEELRAALADLRGRDLACFCPVEAEWCHADVLLDVANRPRPVDPLGE